MRPGKIAKLACILEVLAAKAGNVHVGASFDDLDVFDFIRSAKAIVGPLNRASEAGVGPTVLAAVRATRESVSTNTNLGIVLLLAPLAALGEGPVDRGDLRRLLESTTVEDARAVYRAIRLAAPGGLGGAENQDVRDEPTETLMQVMARAADRDLIARQYATAYADVFEVGLPTFEGLVRQGVPLPDSIVRTHLVLLARLGDSLIARKLGQEVSAEAAARAGHVLEAPSDDPDEFDRRFRELDAWLRADGHRRNPGATADLIAATLYIALQNNLIHLAHAPIARPGEPLE